jgi:hypothetical protein
VCARPTTNRCVRCETRRRLANGSISSVRACICIVRAQFKLSVSVLCHATDYAPEVVAHARAAAGGRALTKTDLRQSLVIVIGAAVLHMRAKLPYKKILAVLDGELSRACACVCVHVLQLDALNCASL